MRPTLTTEQVQTVKDYRNRTGCTVSEALDAVVPMRRRPPFLCRIRLHAWTVLDRFAGAWMHRRCRRCDREEKRSATFGSV